MRGAKQACKEGESMCAWLQREDGPKMEAAVLGPHCVLTADDSGVVPGGSSSRSSRQRSQQQQAQQSGDAGGMQYYGGGGARAPNGEAVLMEAPILSIKPLPTTENIPGRAYNSSQQAPQGEVMLCCRPR